MNLISIPAFQDNYIWLLANQQGRWVIVDPGEAGPVLTALCDAEWHKALALVIDDAQARLY